MPRLFIALDLPEEVTAALDPGTEAAIHATLDRAYANELWSKDGQVSQPAWDNALKVQLGVGRLEKPVAFEEAIDKRAARN